MCNLISNILRTQIFHMEAKICTVIWMCILHQLGPFHRPSHILISTLQTADHEIHKFLVTLTIIFNGAYVSNIYAVELATSQQLLILAS